MRCEAQMKRMVGEWLLVGPSVCGACGGGSSTNNAVSANDPAPVAKRPVAVNPPPSDPLASVGGNSILTVLSVEHQVDVSSERDGVVVAIEDDEGKTVQAGETLGQLDDRELLMELLKARDDLE